MDYQADSTRYQKMCYRRCGKSGIKLPLLSLGMWHNFGNVDSYDNARQMAYTAFDAGITHFDLANNYGPEPGSAEITFGKILKDGLEKYRDEILISSKAGYTMWDGPYGDWGSRKYLTASCDQSLKRLGVDYVDIFYHHRYDPETPLEETMNALADLVHSGKALYAGLSNYPLDKFEEAVAILRELNVPCLLHQIRFNMLDRGYQENGMFDYLDSTGIGSIIFSPMAQGLLTDRYLNGIPADSRAARNHFLKSSAITPELVERLKKLNEIASGRGQTLAQMAIAWILHTRGVTSALIGASSPAQILNTVRAIENQNFTQEEWTAIQKILESR